MRHRIVLVVTIVLWIGGLLGAGAASASVKCQCNNGSVTWDMGADPDDDDVDSACNDACSGSGGGTVWTPEDDDGGDDESLDPVGRRPERVERRR